MVKDQLISNSYEKLTSHSFEESMWAVVHLEGRDKLLIGCIYRSPNADDYNNTQLLHMLERAADENFSHILIVGDFNCKNINWQLNVTPSDPDNFQTKFFHQILESGWYQHVNSETRFRQGQNPSLLDLIFTNEENMVSNLKILSPIGRSDHCVLTFNLVTCGILDKKIGIPKYFQGRYDEMRDYLSQLPWQIGQDQNVSEIWNQFQNKITTATHKFVPVHKPGIKRRKSWCNSDTTRAIKHKHSAWNKYNKNRTPENWDNYVLARNRTTAQVKQAKRLYEKEIANQIKTNPKCFWNMVREKTKVKEGIYDLTNKDGVIITKDEEKANILNSFFVSVFTKEDTSNIPFLTERPVQNILEDISFEVSKISKLLDKLRIDKSPGPDGIHNRVLFEIKDQIGDLLSILFQKSFQSGLLPKEWKEANIVPIYKKGKKSDPNNYRPVSLTSTVCKIMETILRDEIVSHLEGNNLISPDQHGFRSGRSCITQLMESMHDWVDSLENKQPVDVVYLDYKKAFDSVPHERLLVKLHAYGIRGNLLLWIRSFLTNRKQRVVINGKSSNLAPVISGIPQGSVLGPILFLIYVNDLPEMARSKLKLFADDTKLYKSIKDVVDKEILQTDLNSLMGWSKSWQLPFNIGKCKLLHLGTENPEFQYVLTNGNETSTLEEVEKEKDLGIVFDNRLQFEQH